MAMRLAREKGLAHLDLDTIAWTSSSPPQRRSLDESRECIQAFICANTNWVIEGCYSDLLEMALSDASEIIFLNLPVEACIKNAEARPWEPHKYASKNAQDANLPMLIDWIKQYDNRKDTFSREAHEKLFQRFSGRKIMLTSNH